MSVIEIKVPTIGESVTEVTLASWLKEDGAQVNMDEPICEFESDKATLELPAEAAGKLIRVAKEGDDLKIGDIVARIDTAAAGEAAPAQAADPEAGQTRPAPEQKEDKVPAAEMEAEPTAKEPATEKRNDANTTEQPENYATGVPSPAAGKILTEKGIDPGNVKGTGKDGRITKGDALQAEKELEDSGDAPQPAAKTPAPDQTAADTKVAATEKAPAATSQPATEKMSRTEKREKMSRLRRTIATRLVSAKNHTAMLTTFNEVDMTAIMELRKKYQDKFVEKYGIKLGFMSLFAKACATVLMEMREVNAFIDGEEIIYHDYADIAIAISVPNGLVVPPIHNVESLSLAEIEHKVKDLADKARTGKLSLEELKGGTFTITNGGIFGSMMSTPIINEPQSAILGMHAITERPVARDGQVVIRPMMYLALSYDHRIIDGSSSVTFLVKVKNLLEDPTLLFLGL